MTARDPIVVGASACGVEALRAFAAGALAGTPGRSGPLPAVTASDGMALRRGRIHVASPDRRLLVVDGSAHPSHGAGMIGVVPSGALDDDTTGMITTAGPGGLTVVRDQGEALCDGMPTGVLRHLAVDHVLSPAKAGALSRDCVGLRADSHHEPSDLVLRETATSAATGGVRPGERSRCQVGHAWTASEESAT